MQALARFAVLNPHTTAAIYRHSKKGWVIYSLSLAGLFGLMHDPKLRLNLGENAAQNRKRVKRL